MSACVDVTLPPERLQAKPLLLVAAGVLVDADGRVLIASRPPGKFMAGLWEFPGGKLNAGESAEQALVRELHEELGIHISIGCLCPLTFLTHTYAANHLLMPLFVCRVWQGTPMPREGQELAWALPTALGHYDFVPADRPLLPQLPNLL
jgi:8-oxo-dGTP diphosphatase